MTLSTSVVILVTIFAELYFSLNESNTNNMKIIIQLLDDTNFKILFQN